MLGSLWTSIMKPGVFLSGGSGGVYALIMSHLATVIMNHRWRGGGGSTRPTCAP